MAFKYKNIADLAPHLTEQLEFAFDEENAVNDLKTWDITCSVFAVEVTKNIDESAAIREAVRPAGAMDRPRTEPSPAGGSETNDAQPTATKKFFGFSFGKSGSSSDDKKSLLGNKGTQPNNDRNNKI